jgi:hypothetical protein
MMLTTCASCVVVSSHQNQNGKSKRRPFPPQRSNLSTLKNARSLRNRSPFNKTHNALVEDDENSDNDNRSASESILEKMPKKLEPPQRDTGIPSELDINIDIDEGTIFRVFGFCVLGCREGTPRQLSLSLFKLF